MIKVITFDLHGVYFVNGKNNFIASLSKLGISNEEAKRVFLESTEMNERYKKGKMSDEDFWTWAIEEWKLQKPWREIVNLLIDGYEVDKGVVKIVENVKRLGYKTAVCSNNFQARIEGLHKKFKFLDNFDIITLSYEIGATKPDKAIFEKLIERSKVNASEIVFADDIEDRLGGAKELGITTFVYEGFDKYLDQLKSVGVVI